MHADVLYTAGTNAVHLTTVDDQPDDSGWLLSESSQIHQDWQVWHFLLVYQKPV